MSLTGDNNRTHETLDAPPTIDMSETANTCTRVTRPLPRPPHKRGSRKNASAMWDHFSKIDFENKDDVKASCNYCESVLTCPSKSGTSCLRNHLSRCKKYPFNVVDKRQKILLYQSISPSNDQSSGSTQSSLQTWKFDQDLIREAIAKYIIIDELPFKHVEREGFRYLFSMAQPRFQVPCRTTVATDCMKIYVAELEKLKKFFSKFSQRVCLTTDTWTSCQNLNYMCLTAHFIDDDWRLQKRVLNFCLITSHKGIDIGKAVEHCLLEWGISKVLTITVDNASSNDVGITYLKNRFASWKGSVLKGDYLHMRCCAHILSLIVKEGLKDMNDSIFRIRSAVRYVRSSPGRLQRFKECVVKEKIESKSLLVLDVETRWNSTYLMLDAAIKFQKAFDLLESEDSKYKNELSSGERSKGVPTRTDWEYAQYFLPFLKIFYDATLRVSGSLYVTGNIYMEEIFGIGVQIIEWCNSLDPSLRAMAVRMKGKFDKYWSNIDNINIMLFIAEVLDPRHKLEYVEWVIADTYDSVVADRLRTKVKTVLVGLFEEYNLLKMVPSPSVQPSPSEQLEMTGDNDIHDAMFDSRAILQNRYKGKKAEKQSVHKTELEKYLADECEDENDKSFNILTWWKINSIRYPVMSMIARDVLAMPVSTVASESTFSTGGRILDPFRSSLAPKMVEALICAQDWIRASHVPFSIEESLEELAKLEKEFAFLRLENTRAPLDN